MDADRGDATGHGYLERVLGERAAYHAYQARQNYLRQQRSIGRRIQALTAEAAQAQAEKQKAQAAEERERAEKEHARAAKEQARAAEERERAAEEHERAEKEPALAEVERLKRLLKGDPSA